MPDRPSDAERAALWTRGAVSDEPGLAGAVAEASGNRASYCIVLKADQRMLAGDVYRIAYALDGRPGAELILFPELAIEGD